MRKKSFLIDINGVLYVGGKPIPGAIETIDLLRKKDYLFRFVTNATRSSRRTLQKKLLSMGFDIREDEIFSAPRATVEYLKKSGLNKVFPLSTGDVEAEFTDAGIILTDSSPDYVIVGDAGDNFSFGNMNKAFNLILNGAKLIAMEKDRHWITPEGRLMSAGPFVAALEYATGKKATILGKPSKDFFRLALKDMDAKAADTIMIGDDIFTDIGGAQSAGLRAYLVKSGKYNKTEVAGSRIKPDKIINSIADLQGIL